MLITAKQEANTQVIVHRYVCLLPAIFLSPNTDTSAIDLIIFAEARN